MKNEPLEVVARLSGPVAIPQHSLALDALLAWAVCQRDAIPPAYTADEVVDIEVPLEREPGGRFHLASIAEYRVERREKRWMNRRPVVEQAQERGNRSRKRMQISAGPDKGYRVPYEVLYLVEDEMRWWCRGDAEEIRSLLRIVTHLGKKRSVGLGAVSSWSVERCEEWGVGFPVVRDGFPLRNLPMDWPGIVDAAYTGVEPLTYPYWLRERSEHCFVAQ